MSRRQWQINSPESYANALETMLRLATAELRGFYDDDGGCSLDFPTTAAWHLAGERCPWCDLRELIQDCDDLLRDRTGP